MIQWNDLKEWVSTTENEAERFLKTHKKNVFIYGAGIAGYWYLKYLQSKNVNVVGFIVSEISSIDLRTVPGGMKVFSLDEVLSNYKEYSIVIGAPKFKSEIAAILYNKCPKENIYSFEVEIYYTFIHDVKAYRTFLLDNWNRIDALYEELDDQKSKDTLQAFIMGRVSGNQDFFIDNMVPDQYYPKDILQFTNSEVMVECGANNGNTMLDFVHCVKNQYNHIYLFEPDKDCVKKIKAVISDNNLRSIDLIEKGAWNKRTTLTFTGDENYGSGHIIEGGAEIIETETIDNIINIPPTFIKMDIEGAELNALRGGEGLIKKYSPRLAVCVYHNQADFLDIPEYIKSVNNNYRFYLRHHNWGATETVIYAKCEI